MLSFYLALLDDDVEKARFTYIYETYGSDIWKISLGILRDTTSAIDAVDNTLFAISKNINCIPTEPSYERAYIRLVAKNHALNELRKSRKEPEFISLGNFELSTYEAPCVDLTERETVLQIIRCINDMPKTYKEILILKYVYEKSNSEIAEVLGISTNTAKVKSARGTAILRELLESRGIK
jgi:RNA polymerase sigma-70 factor (ECF subfamily)